MVRGRPVRGVIDDLDAALVKPTAQIPDGKAGLCGVFGQMGEHGCGIVHRQQDTSTPRDTLLGATVGQEVS